MVGLSANDEWFRTLALIIKKRKAVAPRDNMTYEILNHTTCVDMTSPIVTYTERKLGYKFMPAEAAFILTGRNTVGMISKYSDMIAKFSDDGYFFNGAYGPMIIDQLTYIVDELIRDKDTRQAVATIWRPNPRPSKDIPCTVAVQFMIRDNKLHIFDTMRSSDIWLGWPYDIFNFSMCAGFVSLLYKLRTDHILPLGNIYLTAASQHLYESDFEKAMSVLENPKSLPYHNFDITTYNHPKELTQWLIDRANDGKILDYPLGDMDDTSGN
jgi:thymidylate synthase